MPELELKFIVDRPDMNAIARDLPECGIATAPAQTDLLQTTYYDTPDNALRYAGIAVRLRKTPRGWVQTIKSNKRKLAGGFAQPQETECAVPEGVLDLDLVENAEMREQVRAIAHERDLKPLLGTEIERTSCILEVPSGTAELALDKGYVIAGSRRAPFCEMELELKSGDPVALYEMAQHLLAGYSFTFSSFSKAHRAARLAAGLAPVAKLEPRMSREVNIDPQANAGDALAEIIHECLEQISTNIKLCVEDDDPEGPHQLRLGLHRLRAGLRLFSPLLADQERESLTNFAAKLSERADNLREIYVVRRMLANAAVKKPRLEKLDKPLKKVAKQARETLRVELRSPEVLGFILKLSQLCALRRFEPQALSPARPIAAAGLSQAYQRVEERASGMMLQNIAERNRLRHALKMLRYRVEFSQGLFDIDKPRRYVKSLRRLQSRLGSMHDYALAQRLLLQAAEDREASSKLCEDLDWLISRLQHRASEDWEDIPTRWDRFAHKKLFWLPDSDEG